MPLTLHRHRSQAMYILNKFTKCPIRCHLPLGYNGLLRGCQLITLAVVLPKKSFDVIVHVCNIIATQPNCCLNASGSHRDEIVALYPVAITSSPQQAPSSSTI